LIITANRRGPSTMLCGTPLLTSFQLEMMPFTLTA
jgi:hypothetical protein